MHWVIGDIHGMLRPLEPLVREIFVRDADAMLIFAGDYVNRGGNTRGVIDFLLTLPPAKAKFVRGNHDDIVDFLVNGHTLVPMLVNEPVHAFQWFFDQGLIETLASYGVGMTQIESVGARPTAKRVSELFEAVPQAHRDFLRELPIVFEDEELFVAHGHWEPGISEADLASQIAEDMGLCQQVLWNRFTDVEIRQRKRWKRPGYFGHTPVHNYLPLESDAFVPVRGPKMWLVDTAAALSPQGRLTAVCHEKAAVLQTDRQGNVVEKA